MSRAFGIPDIDTIYLLTDGTPRDEKNQKIAPELVLAIAKMQNRFRKARVHTVGFAQAGFTMQKLCRDLKATWQCMTLKETDILPIEAEQRAKLKWGCYNKAKVVK